MCEIDRWHIVFSWDSIRVLEPKEFVHPIKSNAVKGKERTLDGIFCFYIGMCAEDLPHNRLVDVTK